MEQADRAAPGPSLARAAQRLSVLAAQLTSSNSGAPAAESDDFFYHPADGGSLLGPSSAFPAVIIGAVVVDVQAVPTGPTDIRKGTSVPGKVRQVAGGVGRNIAQVVSMLVSHGPDPIFISIIGDDGIGRHLRSMLQSLRLDLSCLITVPGVSTPTVAAVFDRAGEVAACVADVSSLEAHFVPQRLQLYRSHIQSAPMVVIDANLPAETIRAACATAAQSAVPVFLEPVSIPKAARCAGALRHASYISPNAAELRSIADELARAAGRPPLPRRAALRRRAERQREARQHIEELAPFAAAVLSTGLKCIVLTLGAQGAALLWRDPSQPGMLQGLHMPAVPAKVVSLSGAGDTLVAGMVAALLSHKPQDVALAYGLAAAKCTVESADNVPASLHLDDLREHAQWALRAQRKFTLKG